MLAFIEKEFPAMFEKIRFGTAEKNVARKRPTLRQKCVIADFER